MTLDESYAEALGLIEDLTGLELSLIERYGLRKMVGAAIARNERVDEYSAASAHGEAVHEWFSRYFGLECRGHKEVYWFYGLRDEVLATSGRDGVREWFWRLQDEMHHL